MRSRVMPGSSPTMDRREPVRRLNSVLLPTFGRPQTAISGSFSDSALSVTVDNCAAIASASRQSSSPIFSRPATLEERGVCRPMIPSAGRVLCAGRSVFLVSNSGERFDTSLALAATAFLVASTLRLRGSTAPVVGATLGARPFLGRVFACLCFLPNRFLSSFCAIGVPAFRHRSAIIYYRDAELERWVEWKL